MKKIENNTKKERNEAEAFIYSLLRLIFRCPPTTDTFVRQAFQIFSLSANHRYIRPTRIRIKVLAHQMQHATFLYSLYPQNDASATFL